MFCFQLTIKILESYEENNHLIDGVKTAEYKIGTVEDKVGNVTYSHQNEPRIYRIRYKIKYLVEITSRGKLLFGGEI